MFNELEAFEKYTNFFYKPNDADPQLDKSFLRYARELMDKIACELYGHDDADDKVKIDLSED